MTAEKEVLEVDVLFVGGGPASLSGAYHLARLLARHNAAAPEQGRTPLDPMIALIDKAGEVGAHGFSGAVMDPAALRELVPDYESKACPIEKTVTSDAVYYLTARSSYKLPYLPPSMSNHGKLIISLAKFNRWLAGLAEGAGVNIFPGFAGVEILEDGPRIAGVRTGDKGIDPSGQPKSNFEPGIDLRAKITVFGDGPRGYLSKQLIKKRNLLRGKPVPVFETGVKEVFEMPPGSVDEGRVIHTLGYPLRRDCVGGTFLYNMGDNLICVGLVVPLDYHDPLIHPHRLLQEFKLHPFIRKLLSGGKSTHYGAKVLNAGGYFSMPRLFTDGALLIGEAASLLDMKHLKGVHLAMKSGMLAAETIFHALLSQDYSESALASYEENVRSSYVGSALRASRHFHRALSLGIPRGALHLGVQQATGGRDLLSYAGISEDYTAMKSVREYHGRDAEIPSPIPADGSYVLDKLAHVYNSGTLHNEDQPPHLKIVDPAACIEKCIGSYKYPCNRFCPAQVYEMIRSEDDGSYRLQINFTNCVHCQTCDIKCPLDNIRWTPPEGGGGPNYTVM
ncbi:MAG: electron transfer flavoprotein-ubiquinone oxidoreductase [Chitinivibrionia bacterium]|nr:electron transfer flavoprotein-ubiquinone oxidoreductase [Chitinivibrionia bacterium]